MWTPPKFKYLQPSAYTVRSSAYIDKDFQLKFTKYIIGITLLTTIVFLLPTLYYANQNYEIFMQLADLMNPELARYIAREQTGLNVFFAVAFMVNMIFWYIFSHSLTAKIAGPIKILRNHIRLLCRGDLSLPAIHLRDNDEFKEMISSYNYFYTLLRSQTLRELEQLKKLKEAVTNPVGLDIIHHMIEERTLRLNEHDQWPSYSEIVPMARHESENPPTSRQVS